MMIFVEVIVVAEVEGAVVVVVALVVLEYLLYVHSRYM